MGIRKYKPTTPGRRGSSVADFVEVTRSTPEKSLVRPLTKSGGRHPVSPWGQAEGRTRRPGKPSDKMIVRLRRTGKKR